MSGIWDQIVDAVCRPPRDVYTDDDLLGKSKGAFAVIQQNKTIRRCYRHDIELLNKRGMKLQCSHFKPNVVPTADGKLPCVVFCHCNSGSRRDAEEAVKELVPRNITVFCMDFEGSGVSEGDWVTLGANEVSDLAVVVDYLRHDDGTSYIGLWGRSMGAVTALMYSRLDPTIAGMVLDSPFSRLTDLMMELVEDQKLPVPKAMLKVAISMLRRSVRKRANFSIDDVAPLDHCTKSHIPALFAHGEDDTFIKKHHTQRLYAVYSGPKELTLFEGDHNDPRPQWFIDAAYFFFFRMFQMETLHLLPQFLEYGLRDVAGTGAAPSGSRASSVTASEDVQYVDEWGSTPHGTPFNRPDGLSMLQQLGQAAVPEDDEEAMLQAALVASLQEQGGTSTPDRSQEGAAELDEEAQLRLAIEASLQDQQAREDYLFSEIAWQERNNDGTTSEATTTSAATGAEGFQAGRSPSGTPVEAASDMGGMSHYLPSSTARGQQNGGPGVQQAFGSNASRVQQAQVPPRSPPTNGDAFRDGDDSLTSQLADVRNARRRTAGSSLSRVPSARRSSTSQSRSGSPYTENGMQSAGSGASQTMPMARATEAIAELSRGKSMPNAIRGKMYNGSVARQVPLREAHPAVQGFDEVPVSAEMLFSPGHHTAEELSAVTGKSRSRSGADVLRPGHIRSPSDADSVGLPPPTGPVQSQTQGPDSQLDMRRILQADDSMTSWSLSVASNVDDWLLSGIAPAMTGILSPTTSAKGASLEAAVPGLQEVQDDLAEQATAMARAQQNTANELAARTSSQKQVATAAAERRHSAAQPATTTSMNRMRSAVQPHSAADVERTRSAAGQEARSAPNVQKPDAESTAGLAQQMMESCQAVLQAQSEKSSAAALQEHATPVSAQAGTPADPNKPAQLSPRQQAVLQQWEQYRAARRGGAANAGPVTPLRATRSLNIVKSTGKAVLDEVDQHSTSERDAMFTTCDDLHSFDQLDRTDLGDTTEHDGWGLASMTASIRLHEGAPQASANPFA